MKAASVDNMCCNGRVKLPSGDGWRSCGFKSCSKVVLKLSSRPKVVLKLLKSCPPRYHPGDRHADCFERCPR
eukprot:7045025-Pyramimonas_sp.AAC.1